MWDYTIRGNVLIILYPDGQSWIATKNKKLIGEFCQEVGECYTNEYNLDATLELYAFKIMRIGKKD